MMYSNNIQGQVAWKSPSNIALVKYWGKYGRQLPQNASISFTLSEANTKMSVSYQTKKVKDTSIALTFLFEGKENQKFADKISKFLASIISYFPFIPELELKIESENSFPHSTGIASSASSMSALALCLCQIEKNHFHSEMTEDEFYQKASLIARLGSGSACRSVYPKLAMWGALDSEMGSSNEYAIPVTEKIDPIFHTFRDSIFIVSSEEKSVSSRAGHALMEGNPYAAARYAQANQHVSELINAMQNGDLDHWGNIVEKEALTLHALMMASEPPYILMHPNTLKVIEKIRSFRKEKSVPVYFTLDAGPNIHILYPDNVKDMITHFIQEELLSLCENSRVIHDFVGEGPEKI